jgi:hypothetical protein
MGCWCSTPFLRVEDARCARGGHFVTGIPLRLALPLVAMRYLLTSPHKPNLSKGAACCRGGWYLDEFAGVDVVDVAVDGDRFGDERAGADARYIGED